MAEIYAKLDQLAKSESGLYVEKKSMGQSTGGRDMPYLIVADRKESVDQWLDFVTQAKKNPDEALKKLKNGELKDLRVPVMYSNVHANEVAAADGVMDFAEKLINGKTVPYQFLTAFTEAGKAKWQEQMGPEGEEGSVAVPDLAKKDASYLGFLYKEGQLNRWGEEVWNSAEVDLDKYYEKEERTFNAAAVLKDVFFILVPEENVDGRTFILREGENGYDFNRDNSFQTTNETSNMQHIIGYYDPVSFVELHGLIEAFQVEPCGPPHEPNFEYDLLSRQLIKGGEALGIAAVANNEHFNSYKMPMRDYLQYTGKKTENGENETFWGDPWDDMSTSYTPQFSMLQGTVAYTVELPSYSDDGVKLASYGIMGQADYIAKNKLSYLTNQLEIFKRGADNYNSDKEVAPWLTNQYDVEGAEADLFRPEYKGEGENGSFFPEAYIIPVDSDHQNNRQAARDMLVWLARNDVKINFTTSPITANGKSFPAGTAVVSMYQAKRSVANGALYNGTFIDSWSTLYSEGITAFNKTRGFDMETVTKPAEFNKISPVLSADYDYAAIQEYAGKMKDAVNTVGDCDLLIHNTSLAAVEAVNTLLKKGKTVAMVTEGEMMGNFIVSKADYETIKDAFTITASGLTAKDKGFKARVIRKIPQVYIVGRPADNKSGFVHTSLLDWNNSDYNYDRLAMKLMDFNTTQDVSQADIVIGAKPLVLDAKGLDAVKKGKPYIGYSPNVDYSSSRAASLSDQLFQGKLEYDSIDWPAMDLLSYAKYPNKTLLNANYLFKGDEFLYGYGAGWFTKLPEGAITLVQTDGSKEPLEGFLPRVTEEQKNKVGQLLNNSIQGFEYKSDSLDLALFANTLTNKGHQRDEYYFISNFIFSRLLGDEYKPTVGFTDHWEAIDGVKGKNKCYYKNGKRLTGLNKIGNTTYLFDRDGECQYGWHKVNGYDCYFTPKDKTSLAGGGLQTGLRKVGSTYYLFASDKSERPGEKLTNWHKLNGKEYYFDPAHQGGMLTGLRKVGKTSYLFASMTDKLPGAKLYGWHKLNGYDYYFNPKQGGGMVTGIFTPNKTTYLFGNYGTAKAGVKLKVVYK